MATVYFVREGSGNGCTNEGREIPLVKIAKAFPNRRAVWSEGAPVFNPESPVNPASAHRYVVVHVQGGEVAGRFTRDGYWYLQGISPIEFERRFSHS